MLITQLCPLPSDKTPPMTTALEQQRWHGFYHPTTGVPRAAAADRAKFNHLAHTPICTPGNARDFISAAARVLPSYGRFAEHVAAGHVRIEMGTHPAPVFGNEGEMGILRLPTHRPPSHYLPLLWRSSGSLLPAPEGLAMPPQVSGHNADEFTSSILRNSDWGTALGASYLYQLYHEMTEQDLAFTSEKPIGRLHAMDIELFRVFRTEGLIGYANAYPHCLPPKATLSRTQMIRTQVERLIASGGLTVLETPWTLPALGPRPDLLRTHLDDLADFQEHYRLGLYQAALTEPLDTNARNRINTLLNRTANKPQDLELMIGLTQMLAPALAKTMAPLLKDALENMHIETLPPQYAALLLAKPKAIAGLSKEPPQYAIQKGARLREILPRLIYLVAQQNAPREMLNDTWAPTPHNALKPTQQDAENLATHYLELYGRADIWGQSALFQFSDEATQNGIELPLTDQQALVKSKLTQVGLFVVANQWEDYVSPFYYQTMMEQFLRVAVAILLERTPSA
jgi:hypothetical protein